MKKIRSLRLSFVVATAAAFMACPGPQEPLTSVDGLSGGSITSKLTVPDLSAASAEVTDLVATTTSTEELSATTADLGAARFSTLARADAPAYAIGAVPVGTVLWGFNERGYAEVSGQCATAFPSTTSAPPAHLCSQQEVMMTAMTAPDRFTPAMDGALFATFAAKGVPLPDPNGDTFFNDCAAFVSEASFLDQEYRAFASVIRVVDGKTYPEFATCGPNLSELLCCQ
jgi:hypothetical protein